MIIGIDCRLWEETGVGRYVRNLVLELSKIDKKNQYVLFLKRKEFNEVKIPSENFQKRMVDIQWHTLSEQLNLPSILNKENLDLIHFPYISVPFFYNKPFVVTIHDLIPYHFSTGKASALPLPIYGLKLAAYKLIVSNAAKKAKKIIVPSNATKEEVVKHLNVPAEKIVVIYEGVSENLKFKNPFGPSSGRGQKSKLSPQMRDSAEAGQLKIKNYFLYVGNAYPHKNLDRLLSAFNILISQYPNISLVLVGREDYFYKRLKERAKKLGVLGSVIFIGGVDDQKLTNLYKNALAFVTPSLMEGFGLPGLEAMSNGCLILASDIPVHKEIYKDSAIYFDPKNMESIKNIMRDVYSNTLMYRSKKKDFGFKRVKEFSWKNTAEETLKIYESSASSDSW